MGLPGWRTPRSPERRIWGKEAVDGWASVQPLLYILWDREMRGPAVDKEEYLTEK